MAVIVVGGALANRPGNGGGAWVRLNWILGLKRLGHTVHFLEEIDPATCVDETGRPCSFVESVNFAFFRLVTNAFGLNGRSTLVSTDRSETYGLTLAELSRLAAGAELLINLGGHLALTGEFARFRRKVYIDLDPGYTQFWYASDRISARLAEHDFYYTVGANIGTPGCSIPTEGYHWRPIRPPIVLDQWPLVGDVRDWRFTTVASWRGAFGPVEFGGKTYGVKAHQFRKVVELPGRAGLPFEVALAIHPADAKDRDALTAHGWRVTNPAAVACDPAAFRRYVQGSAAEFSAAQGIYVDTASGWFSDRTACYLASGKPVLVQYTGPADELPMGEGLLTYQTIDEAADAAVSIYRDYGRHSLAARAVAEQAFDSNRILSRLLQDLGV